MNRIEALENIEKAAREKATVLDLCDYGLTELPAEIAQLTNLTWLSLHGNELTGLPPEIGQAVLVLGVIIIVIHLGIHIQKTGTIRHTEVLVTEPGLFRYVRYPVHFGELVMGLGMVLLCTDAASPVPWLIMIYALVQQCDDEDEEMLDKYGDVSVAWLTQTKRLFPLIW